MMERVEQVARADVPVLILGETGSGKEVIARAIHDRSRRSDRPFLRVNCGAIPPDLIDSELFGHEKGAFTGAGEARAGWFERADGGTLFLDEVGELPAAAQVRLLRVLQDGSVDRVGSRASLHVDVRVIAATHRDLPAMISERKFREDLWYRLAVFPIRLPAVRERLEDLPALAEHLAHKACRRYGVLPIDPTPTELELLRSYHWPGNVREMGAVMDRAVILGEGRRLEIAQALGLAPVVSAAYMPTTATSHPPTADGVFPTLDAAMTAHIRAALARCRGKVEGPQGAASLLGINPHTLRARMRKLGIEWSSYRAKSTT